MNCLVVGANGYIGSSLARALTNRGEEVLRVGGPVGARGQSPWSYSAGLYTTIQAELSSVDVVVYAAGRVVPSTNVTPTEALELDAKPLSELLDALARCGRKPRFVFISSAGAVYGPAAPGQPLTEDSPREPLSVYGLVRLTMEQLVGYATRKGVVDGLTLRLSNVYGGGQRRNGPAAFVIRALHACRTGKPMELWGDGSQRKDFVYIDDVLGAIDAAVLALAEGRARSRVYNVCTGQSVSLRQILSTIEQVSGRPVPLIERPPLQGDVPVELLPDRAASELGWRASVSLAEGLKRALRELEAEAHN